MTTPSRRAVIYARISTSTEESVSLERQIEAAEQHAAGQGWRVVETFVDDGVSATHNKPEDRAGWRALLDSSTTYDAVLIWKVDRLARRTLDFLNADQALQERGAGIVAVDDPLDMTTALGRAFATLLAVFAEMEAEAIRARVTAARKHLLRAGRHPGGTVPYGWRAIRNPEGPGYVLERDPDRIGYVKDMVAQAQRGATIYSIVQYLDEIEAPLPTASQGTRKRPGWSYNTVHKLLRNPVLAGLTASNPGNTGKDRGAEVLRDPETGLPVVDPSVAIMPVPQWRAMVQALDERNTGSAMPHAMRASTSPLLSGLVRCGQCDGARMHRSRSRGTPGYTCPKCTQTISNIEDYVVEQFLYLKGDHVRWSIVEEVYEGGAAQLPEIEHRLEELASALRATDDDAEADEIMGQMTALRRKRREAREVAPKRVYRSARDPKTFSQDWASADDAVSRREVLDDALVGVTIRRGRLGRGLDKSRLTFNWHMPEHLGPLGPPADDETMAEWADDDSEFAHMLKPREDPK